MTRTNLFRRRYAPVGRAPGDLSASTPTSEPSYTLMAYDAETLQHWTGREAQERFEAAEEGSGRVLWFNQECVGETEVAERVGLAIGLHTTLVSDLMHMGQRPKYEPVEGGLFVVLRNMTLDADGHLQWEQVGLASHGSRVWTVQEREGDCLAVLDDRLHSGRPRIRGSGADYLSVMVFDSIVDGYFPVLEALGDRLEDLEEQLLDEGEDGVLEALYHAKRDLVHVRRAAAPLLNGLQQLLRDEPIFLKPETLPYLRDVVDHLNQLVELTESYRELADGLIDVHFSTVSMRTNEIMQMLAVVSTIFIPLTFLAGVYGMNFDRAEPGNLPELGLPYGYAIFWCLCALIGSGLLVFFRRLGWLRFPASW